MTCEVCSMRELISNDMRVNSTASKQTQKHRFQRRCSQSSAVTFTAVRGLHYALFLVGVLGRRRTLVGRAATPVAALPARVLNVFFIP